ncbi:MAG: SEC-C domain-containing protein [Verrucomicrobia bacterium]|nr:SEC-C domain-containing protein [Verrucomicrobiota bacterium]
MKLPTSKEACPCESGKTYGACCQIAHQGKAPTALALMRSRYCAYAIGLVDYIVRTTHPLNREAAKSLEERKKEIEQFCKSTDFKGLKILDVQEGETKSTVTFTAFLSQAGKDFSFTEKSTFEKVLGSWLYWCGEFS